MNGLFNYFAKRADTPIETRDYGKVYLALSALLFLGTMWAVLDEVTTRRPWKETQRDYLTLSAQKWTEKRHEAIVAFDSSKFAELEGELRATEAKLSSPEIAGLLEEIRKLDNQLLDANRDFTFAKSRSDEAYYFWKKSIHEGKENPKYKQDLANYETQMATFNARVEALTAERDTKQRAVEEIRNHIRTIRSQIKDLHAEIETADGKIARAKESPILIRQVMINNFDRSNFGIPKARIDRCQTCHMGWKDDQMAEAPQPYTTHPLPELLKIHDPEVFGCTPCHRGQGPALTAGLAHGNDDHYWEWPLLRGREVYASCQSCHANELYLKFGDTFNKGKQILTESGCFGCHEISGFTDLRKIGPELNQLPSKTSAEWVFRWVRNPKDYNAHTRMPNFRFNDPDAEAITAYLWNVGSDHAARSSRPASVGGNPTNGKRLFESVGCQGCHVMGEDTRLRDARKLSFDIAPELTRAGSKLDPEWMVEWVKNPKRFRPETPMPDLRLSDQDARDIVAYVTAHTDDRRFEQKKLALNDPAVIKRGEKLIREYGCAGCHAIKGMEKESRVSVALSNFGRKRPDELDFGDTKIPHTWDDWVAGKLTDARMYTTERIISKMPVFAFADDEIVALRTLLRGMTKEAPEQEYRHSFDARMQAIEAGRRLTKQYNCVNCHVFEENGGAVAALLDDPGLAPPYLFPEGSKVQETWLYDFLRNPSTIRPWLKLRMPTFHLTDAEIDVITKYFLALHKKQIELRDYKSFALDPKYVSAGKQIFNDFQCLSCHFTGSVPQDRSPSDLAPNLSMAKGRLKPEWVLSWIARPDSIQPGTRMPTYFPDMESPDPEILGGDAREQIRGLRDYIWSLAK
jgi:mono/diheme cytochrome c family protein